MGWNSWSLRIDTEYSNPIVKIYTTKSDTEFVEDQIESTWPHHLLLHFVDPVSIMCKMVFDEIT